MCESRQNQWEVSEFRLVATFRGRQGVERFWRAMDVLFLDVDASYGDLFTLGMFIKLHTV